MGASGIQFHRIISLLSYLSYSDLLGMVTDWKSLDSVCKPVGPKAKRMPELRQFRQLWDGINTAPDVPDISGMWDECFAPQMHLCNFGVASDITHNMPVLLISDTGASGTHLHHSRVMWMHWGGTWHHSERPNNWAWTMQAEGLLVGGARRHSLLAKASSLTSQNLAQTLAQVQVCTHPSWLSIPTSRIHITQSAYITLQQVKHLLWCHWGKTSKGMTPLWLPLASLLWCHSKQDNRFQRICILESLNSFP